ncbi:MAG: HAD family hydrolase [Lachnospiraceae bacterium]|nr:HAD family hydrolase [Lachnospiraceae bacterium]
MIRDNYIFDLYGTLIDVHTEEHEPKLWKQMSRYLKDNFNINIKGEDLYREYTEAYDSYVKELKTIVKSDHPEIRISWVWDDILWNHICSPWSDCKPGTEKELSAKGIVLAPRGRRRPHMFGIDNPKDIAPQHIAKLCAFFRQTSTYHMHNYPETCRMLKTLKENGKRVYLLSNAQRAFTQQEIGACRLKHFFDDIFISSDKLIMKPEPRYLQMLIDKHDLDKSKCVMIGNEIKSDIEIAKRCGICSILVQNGDFAEVLKGLQAYDK